MVQTTWKFAKIDYSDKDFEQFWELFPNKDGKHMAAMVFKRIKKSEPGVIGEIIDGARYYQTKCIDMNPMFIMRATTFLNQRRWEDKPLGSKPSKKRALPDVKEALGEKYSNEWDRIYAEKYNK